MWWIIKYTNATFKVEGSFDVPVPTTPQKPPYYQINIPYEFNHSTWKWTWSYLNGTPESWWIVRFANMSFKVEGIFDVVRSHVMIPDVDRKSPYYEIGIPHEFDPQAWEWLWSYLNGRDIRNKKTLTDASYLPLFNYLFFMKFKETSYPVFTLLKTLMSSNHGPQSPFLDKILSRCIDAYFKEGKMRLLSDMVGEGNYPLMEADANYFSILVKKKDVLPPSLRRRYSPSTFRWKKEAGFGGKTGFNAIVPIEEKVYLIIGEFQWSTSDYPAPLVRSLQVDGLEISPEMEAYRSKGGVYWSRVTVDRRHEARGGGGIKISYKVLYLFSPINDPTKTFILDKEKGLRRLPWITFLSATIDHSSWVTRPITAGDVKIPPTPLLNSPNFILTGRKVVGYPDVMRERSLYVSAIPDEPWISLFPERGTIDPGLIYAWNYINGLDNLLEIKDVETGLRIGEYLNYFDVSLTSDWYNLYLIQLSEIIIGMRDVSFPSVVKDNSYTLSSFLGIVKKINKEQRRLLSVFDSYGGRGSLIDQAVAALVTRKLDPPPLGDVPEITEIFSNQYSDLKLSRAPYSYEENRKEMMAVYSIQGADGKELPLVYPFFLRISLMPRNKKQFTTSFIDNEITSAGLFYEDTGRFVLPGAPGRYVALGVTERSQFEQHISRERIKSQMIVIGLILLSPPIAR